MAASARACGWHNSDEANLFERWSIRSSVVHSRTDPQCRSVRIDLGIFLKAHSRNCQRFPLRVVGRSRRDRICDCDMEITQVTDKRHEPRPGCERRPNLIGRGVRRRRPRKRKKSKLSGLKRGQKRISAVKHFRETFLRIGLIAPDTEFNRRAAAYAQESARMAAQRMRIANV